MKFGDVVLVFPEHRASNKSAFALIVDEHPPSIEEWGEQIAGECDCFALWNSEIIPFSSEICRVI